MKPLLVPEKTEMLQSKNSNVKYYIDGYYVCPCESVHVCVCACVYTQCVFTAQQLTSHET